MILELSPEELAILENALLTSIMHAGSADEIAGFRGVLSNIHAQQNEINSANTCKTAKLIFQRIFANQ